MGLKARLPTFVVNFLTNRSFKTKIGSTLSETKVQKEWESPQGGILSVNKIVECVNPELPSSFVENDFLSCYSSNNMCITERPSNVTHGLLKMDLGYREWKQNVCTSVNYA